MTRITKAFPLPRRHRRNSIAETQTCLHKRWAFLLLGTHYISNDYAKHYFISLIPRILST